MKYMMFVVTDGEPYTSAKPPSGSDRWLADVREKRIIGNRLRPAGEAKSVRVRSGQVIVTDGPFAESKETIIGFDILDCNTLEEAIDIASRHPLAQSGRLELRAFWPFEE